jgi:hypothetical protein
MLAGSSTVEVSAFLYDDLLPALSPETRAFFITSDVVSAGDYTPLFAAARQLGCGSEVIVGPDGADIVVPDAVERWRQNTTARFFMETLLLCKATAAQVASDQRAVFGFDGSEEDVRYFGQLFIDQDFVKTGWLTYMRCIGDAEAMAKRRLMEESLLFVRWKLGVRVQLDNEMILDRLSSDAYFTERLLKHEAGELGIRMDKDTLLRIKLERDTVFKSIAMRIKLKESGNGDTGATNEIANALKGVILEYGKQDMPTFDDIAAMKDGPDTLGELEIEDKKSV